MQKRTLTIGKYRGLQRCASLRGTFTALALDHRQNLRRALNPAAPQLVSDAELTAFKLQVCAALGESASAVLLDPEYSAAQAIAAHALPPAGGLVVALEATGYTGDPTERHSQLLPGWSAAQARRLGADMVKLLVYYHPDSPSAAKIEDFVSQVAGQCAAEDLALMLEPLSYSLNPAVSNLSSAEKRYVVVETARRLTLPGVDLLKAEFPLSGEDHNPQQLRQACAEITTASHAPWILLSAAVAFEIYLEQVIAACQAGASGVAVGRAVWQEAVSLQGSQRQDFLVGLARQRLARLSALCLALAQPFTAYYEPPELTPTWYLSG